VEIERAYPDLAPGAVHVTGAPQFDLHRDPARVLDEAVWRDRLGLPPDRPVILYGAGPEELLPGEPALVIAIDEAIARGRISGDPVVLLRGHPADPADRWTALDAREHIVVAPGWGRADGGLAWPSDDEIDVQISTFAHAAVHVNICSSMSIDGAAFDRPVITPTFVPDAPPSIRRRIRSLYRQEHWQPIARSGGVTAVGNEAELVAAIERALADPGAGHEGRRRLVADLLTYDDGRSSARVVAEVAEVLGHRDRPS
jgi:CDP-glycerol glycerophosphotransferase (TagB/SpsB family)